MSYQVALKIKKKLENENINCCVAHFGTIKPLDENFLKKSISKSKKNFYFRRTYIIKWFWHFNSGVL